ncbi:MAG TPA: hypothetical protein VGH91_01810 [Gammaproteobacteria bacterium]|jgi:hypothetical protein
MQDSPETPILGPFWPGASRSRIRLSKDAIERLGWEKTAQDFDVLAIWRRQGELYCAPDWLKNAQDSHPFAEFFEATVVDQASINSLKDVPPSSQLVLGGRTVKFKAVWVKAANRQLDLQAGNEIREKLGWTNENPTGLYQIFYREILILMSQKRLDELERLDIFELIKYG